MPVPTLTSRVTLEVNVPPPFNPDPAVTVLVRFDAVVAVVAVPVKLPTKLEAVMIPEILTFPLMSSADNGFVVPIPTKLATVRLVLMATLFAFTIRSVVLSIVGVPEELITPNCFTPKLLFAIFLF
jgi:hypothetical protein